jgi:hypothetical protein
MKHSRADYDRIQDPAGLIPDDEPVFLLRGQDELAAQHVRDWAEHAELRGCSPEVVAAARAHADKMDAWPKKKLADLPVAHRASA